MRSKRSRFTLGVWGLRACSLNVAQPSATVRVRSLRCACGDCCKSGHFWKLQTSRRRIPCGKCGTLWPSCQKLFLCDRRNNLSSLSEDYLHFSRRAKHFGRVHLHVAWQAQHFRRVVLGVFCESRRLHFTLHTLHSTIYTLHSTLRTPQSPLHTLPYTRHSPLNTPLSSRSTLCASFRSTLHGLHRHGNWRKKCTRLLK